MEIDVQAQLNASIDAIKVAEILSARGVEEGRAKRLGELIVTMADPSAYDASIWKAAERLFQQMEPMADARTLIQAPSRLRQFYLVCAMHTVRGFESVLTGLVNRVQIETAYADYMTHRENTLARTEAKRLDFPRGA